MPPLVLTEGLGGVIEQTTITVFTMGFFFLCGFVNYEWAPASHPVGTLLAAAAAAVLVC